MEKKALGKRFREARLNKKYTQEVLAEKANICNSQQMSNIERGLSGVSVARFKDICRVLDIEADYLLFGITAKNSDTLLSKYTEKMNPEQIENLMQIVKLYAEACGVQEG